MRILPQGAGYPGLNKPLPCAQCGRPLFSPAWSENISETRVRYLWSCHACDYEFETIIYLSSPSQDVPHAA